MTVFLWACVVAAAGIYFVFGLLILSQANERWEAGFDEVMGSPIAQFVGWLLWPLSLLLIAVCHRAALRNGSVDEHSQL